MSDPQQIQGVEEAVSALLADKKPVSEADHRKHLLSNHIFPAVEKWGFEERFHQELAEMHPKQQVTYDRMLSRMAGKGAIVALIGERGLGKTSLAAQFAIKTAWKNYFSSLNGSGFRRHVIYRKCARIVDRYKPLFADFGSLDSESLRASLEFLCKEQEYLVIDEIHECDDMKFKRLIITDLVDRRYACRRDTILIANQTAKDFAATIGDSILSRLSEHGEILECKWPSYRVQS